MSLEIGRTGATRSDGRAAFSNACRIARAVTGLGTSELEARHDVPHKLPTVFDGHATLGRAARWPLCALALTMLTGCLMVGPDFQSCQRESVPGTAVLRGAQLSAHWWDVFRSRNLNRLSQDGIENNPDLQA